MKVCLSKRRLLAAACLIIAMSCLALVYATSEAAAKSKGKYWIKVNAQRNVVTVFKKSGGKWKPLRAMLCTTGSSGTPTPLGNFRTGGKWRWLMMNTNGAISYEQYVTRFYGEYYFHSVPYAQRTHSKQYTSYFNQLGSRGSHGCIRLSVMDAKWLYDHADAGTLVTIYRSDKSGPLGRPKPIKVKNRGLYWDPTDPAGGNPNFRLRRPSITIKKKKTVQYGSKYKLKSGVRARNTNAIQDLTGLLKIKKLTRNGKRIDPKKFSTRKLGTYKVTYRLKDKYSRSNSKTFTFKVVDTKKPVITASNRKAALNSGNAVKGVRAKQPTANRTRAVKTMITTPASKKTAWLSYAKARKYRFDQEGKYTILYKVNNKSKKSVVAKKKITVTVTNPLPTTPEMSGDTGAAEIVTDEENKGVQ